MSEFHFPSTWLSTKLEQSVEILDSIRVPVNNTERLSRINGKSNDQLYPYYGATGEVGKIDDYLFDEELVALGEDGVPFLDSKKSKAYLLEGKTWVNNHAHVLKGWPDGMINRFLLHYLNQFNYLGYVNGGTRLKLTQASMKKISVPLPPLAEQKVIAEKLDTLLAQVETTKDRLESILETLKLLRQSVLAAAVSGKLTEDWRNSSIGYIKAEYIEWKWHEVPENWTINLYSDLVDSRLGKMLDKSKNTGSATKYLGNINVRWFEFDLSNTQEILVSDTEQEELSLCVGDVLICEGGEPGRCAIWEQESDEPIVFQKALHRARVKEEMLPEWLVFNLKNDADSLTLNQLFTGTTIKHLTGKALKKYPLRVPPYDEQKEIVNRVEKLFASADFTEQQVNQALERVNNLTQSILAKAFRGELTEQWRKDNPDLISGDNSAEALLKKIKAEREAAKPKRKTNK